MSIKGQKCRELARMASIMASKWRLMAYFGKVFFGKEIWTSFHESRTSHFWLISILWFSVLSSLITIELGAQFE